MNEVRFFSFLMFYVYIQPLAWLMTDFFFPIQASEDGRPSTLSTHTFQALFMMFSAFFSCNFQSILTAVKSQRRCHSCGKRGHITRTAGGVGALDSG